MNTAAARSANRSIATQQPQLGMNNDQHYYSHSPRALGLAKDRRAFSVESVL